MLCHCHDDDHHFMTLNFTTFAAMPGQSINFAWAYLHAAFNIIRPLFRLALTTNNGPATSIIIFYVIAIIES